MLMAHKANVLGSQKEAKEPFYLALDEFIKSTKSD
jgi:hypothetical protein